MNDLVKEIADESRLEVVRDIAKKLLALGDAVEKGAKVTGLPQDEVEEMRRNLHIKMILAAEAIALGRFLQTLILAWRPLLKRTRLSRDTIEELQKQLN